MIEEALEVCLDELIVDHRTITYGVVKPGPEDENGVLFVRGGDIYRGKLNLNNLRTITEDVSKAYSRTLLKGGELLISLVGNPGEVAVASDSLIGANIARQVGLIPLRENVNAKFVMYYLMSPRGKAQIFMRTQGAVQQVINLADIKKVPVFLPSKPVQDKVVKILSSYDELIESNKRRIELLEESARQLYKEWFVRFRFPGHEHVKIIDGVPAGWEKTTAEQVIEILSGGTPKTTIPDYWDGDIGFYTPKDSANTVYVSNTEKTITELGLVKCASKLYPKDTLFITARGTVGKLNLAQKPMAMNQSCYALVGKEPVNQIYLFFAMQAGIQQVKSRAVGAVFDAIIKDTFKVIPFVVPPERLIEEFTDYAESILKQIDCLLISIEKLTQARDILLPKLMNGEIAV